MAERLLSALGIAGPFLVIVAVAAVVVLVSVAVLFLTEPTVDPAIETECEGCS